ncbi:TIGR03086 family metal-binding protein [Streptomyces endophytica]|uniref:TIGR03086 family metal-binding protein n=1 Tax=Streptomyces endophytica TaxID=2991496 RepID=A0ABY6PHB3_9ACTN|nr:TIGR03086 family metal-binding protein [Streptomyces endophytica]UZJ32883.1 TIGR03086 family metal-binding protein [Streptomyces endophytica]
MDSRGMDSHPSDSHPADPRAADFGRLKRLHAQAVRDSVTLVRRVRTEDLARPTPCAAWTLADLLAHMTVQHHGFAAAARGDGRDPAHWAVRPLGPDPVAAYGAVAEQVIAAFAAVDDPDRVCHLPEFSAAQTFPAHRAIGFHLIDYVVHGWDVARTLGLGYDPGPELLRATLPIARAVPDDDSRLAPGSAFRPGLPADGTAGELDRILALLGRSPSWHAPEDPAGPAAPGDA